MDAQTMAENNITRSSFEFKYAYTFGYLLIAFVGATSNVLLLIAFNKDPLKCFINSGTYLVMNLSVSDLLTCLFVPFFRDIVITGLDSVFDLLYLSFESASLISIASISIDRFLIVAHPLKHRYLIKERKVMVLWLSGIWLGSSTLPILRLFYGDKRKDTLPINCSGVIVIILSAVMYAATYSKLKKHSKNIALQNSTESRAQEIRILKKKQFLKTIILIAFIAFVCIVPSMTYFQLHDSLRFSKDNLVHVILAEMTSLIFYTNFAVNPLIYILRLRNYRKTFHLIYCRRWSPC
jgi:hypothetical protein